MSLGQSWGTLLNLRKKLKIGWNDALLYLRKKFKIGWNDALLSLFTRQTYIYVKYGITYFVKQFSVVKINH